MKASSKKLIEDLNKENSDIIEEKIYKPGSDSIIRKYKKGRYLGKGGFAKCYEFTNLENNKILAAKIVSKQTLIKTRTKQKLMSEIRIHRSLDHSGVVKFEHYFEDVDNVYILLEMCHNQTLNELIRRRKKLYEIEVQCYLLQLIEAIKYLHSKKVIHRDLKLGNLFLTEKMELKIGDFGLATKLEYDGEKKRTICGTPNYIAPEILEGKQGHSFEVDIWSIGVIIYTLIIGKPPFETQDVKSTYKKIKQNSYSFPENSNISDECKELIQQILNSDPNRRPKIEDIALSRFLTRNQIPKILPNSTLACPPSTSFLKQYPTNSLSKADTDSQPIRLEATEDFSSKHNQCSKDKFLFTDRGKMLSNNKDQLTSRKNNIDKLALKPNSVIENIKITEKNNQIKEQKTLKENVIKKTEKSNKNPEVSVTVKEYIDYTSKYGLVYLLTNGVTGICFNDATKMIMDMNKFHFDYISKNENELNENIKTYTLSNYPKDLTKKVTLLQYFRNHLEGENNVKREEEHVEPQKLLKTPIYIKKWLKLKHAYMFRMNNKVVQVNFEDKTEISLNSQNKTVTYLNKLGDRDTYTLCEALESDNAEMTKRLKYTKDILTQMLSNNSKPSK